MRKFISAAFFFLFMFSAVSAVLILLGVGIGFLLSALLPGVDLAAGIVAGAVFSLGITDVLRRIVAALLDQDDESGEEEEEEDADRF